MATTTLKVQGMSCQHCVRAVTGALEGVSGVKNARVEIGRAVVDYDEQQTSAGELAGAVTDEGYPAEEVA